MALGFDRLVAILAGEPSIREVIAFPKTQKAACPLTEAPGPRSPPASFWSWACAWSVSTENDELECQNMVTTVNMLT